MPLGSGGSMSSRRLAWGAAALAWAFFLSAAVIALAAGSSLAAALDEILGVAFVFSLAFPVLGALVVGRRGSHAVGWLMIAIGVSIAFHTAVAQWAEEALIDHPGSLPAGDFASWVGLWAWLPGWTLATTLLPVLFPDGRVVGRRRVLAWIDGIAVAAVTSTIALIGWHLRGPRLVEGSDVKTPASFEHVAAAGFLVIGVLTLVSMGSLLIRHRRATADMRRQIAWVVYGAVIAVLMSLIGVVADMGGLFQVLEAGALVAGLAVAMLRYRLYDIEVVVNRTLVYGSLTATLAGTYLVSVLLIQLVLSPSSSVAVAASTLGVAALFRPALAAIQAAVDRRFYRHKYDAAHTLAQFGARLRDQVDLRALDAELRAVVRETLQPTHVSLWLRAPEGQR